jgi:hypothetical protein
MHFLQHNTNKTNKTNKILETMWGKKRQDTKESDFFKGHNIFERLNNSMFGKINKALNEVFSPEEMKTYKLPKVITIGNESTGKSSLLENITKCQLFPRDSKLCTKCPIHIKMKNGKSKYSVYYTENGKLIFVELKDKKEIFKVVNDYMKKMPNDAIFEDEITVDMTDENVPNLELYDLPGIRTYPPEAATTSVNLCKKYLSDKNSIILCVIPATTTRLTSCQSIALITEMKMEKSCILALTMADRLQSENLEELLIKRILKTSDEINNLNFAGYVAVVNRTHANICDLEENDINEKNWFNDNILSCIPDEYMSCEKQIVENLGVANIVIQIDNLYNNFIHNEWKPNIISSINKKVNDYDDKVKQLGEIVTEETVKKYNEKLKSWMNQIYQETVVSFVEFTRDNIVVSTEIVEKIFDSESWYNIIILKEYVKELVSSLLCNRCNAEMLSLGVPNWNGNPLGNPLRYVGTTFEVRVVSQIWPKISEKFNSSHSPFGKSYLDLIKNIEPYEMKRFSKLNSMLQERIKKSITEKIKSETLDIFSFSKNMIEEDAIINGKLKPYLEYKNIITRLITIRILTDIVNPLHTLFTKEDYEESQKWKDDRKDFENKILIAKSHKQIIMNLPQKCDDYHNYFEKKVVNTKVPNNNRDKDSDNGSDKESDEDSDESLINIVVVTKSATDKEKKKKNEKRTEKKEESEKKVKKASSKKESRAKKL